jgi:hypothetical protein
MQSYTEIERIQGAAPEESVMAWGGFESWSDSRIPLGAGSSTERLTDSVAVW